MRAVGADAAEGPAPETSQCGKMVLLLITLTLGAYF